MANDVARRAIAEIIAPEWFEGHEERHLLDNYRGQHTLYQDLALRKADEILSFLNAMGYLK